MERGRDDGAELTLPISDIAERFIDLYWQQATPYSPSVEPASFLAPEAPSQSASDGPDSDLTPIERPLVLVQNPGKQAAVISDILRFRSSTGATTVAQARRAPFSDAYRRLVRKVTATVASQPVKYLQNLGGQQDEFIFRRGYGVVILRAGVAYSLRRFQSLIQDAARSAWVNHIRGLNENQSLLGSMNDLAFFLFSTDRESLHRVRGRLIGLEGPRCFYCRAVRSELEVDHFIPFSMYPRDLMHNFVLADPGCNRSKSDSLAAAPHLHQWSDRLDHLRDDLAEIGDEIGVTVDLPTHRNVTRWAYQSSWDVGGRAWLRRGEYATITESDLSFLAA